MKINIQELKKVADSLGAMRGGGEEER